MSSFKLAISVLSLFILAAGCSFNVTVNEKSETDMGSHHVVVKPGSSFTSSSSSSSGGELEVSKFTCGDVSITIKNEELIVNELSYGKLKPSDCVLVDNGTVLVENLQVQASRE